MFININLQFKNPPADFKIINKSKKIQHNPQTALPLKPNEKKNRVEIPNTGSFTINGQYSFAYGL